MGSPLEKARHEKLMLNRLRDNRQKVRDMRRQFTVANSNLDYDKMGSLQQEWGKKFPDMPPLSTATRYVNLYRANQHRTRVMRMLKTLGQSAKYLEKDIYDIEPDLYSTPFPTEMMTPQAGAFGGP